MKFVRIAANIAFEEVGDRKDEFEREFESVRVIVEKIKPITFLDDDRSYVHWNNKLVSISWGYDMLIKILNHRKIYIKS